jgi:hypothetical protein
MKTNYAIGLELETTIRRIMTGAAEVDSYGNPTDGRELPYCCFPDCGCIGARLCMAESGANHSADILNRERETG